MRKKKKYQHIYKETQIILLLFKFKQIDSRKQTYHFYT